MLTFTDTARGKISAMIAARYQDGLALHLSITGKRTDDFEYAFRFIHENEAAATDKVLDCGDFKVFVDQASVPNLKGATVEFVSLGRGSFKIDNPNPVWSDPLALAVAEVVSKRINPGVAAHSGFVTLQDVNDGVVYIEFGGGCMGCGASQLTLKQGIDRIIKAEVPEVKEVVDVTDHSQGKNPFYAPNVSGTHPLGNS